MAPPPTNCGLSLPCSQSSTSDPTFHFHVLDITCTDDGTGGANGNAIVGHCPNSLGAAIVGLAINDFGTARGTGVLGTVQLGQGGQFNSVGGIGVTASAGLPDGGDPRIQGIGVQASGDSMGVLATSPVDLTAALPAVGGGVGVQAMGGRVGVQALGGGGRTGLVDVVQDGVGVSGEGVGGFAVGVLAHSAAGWGLLASSNTGTAIQAFRNEVNVSLAAGTVAGDFFGDVRVTGHLFKSMGGFKIDHPADPANKYLVHSFVESADMKNLYDGTVVLNGSGAAEVELPAWFELLNENFRYQLTPIGTPAPNLHIATELVNGRFRVAGGSSGLKVSWQVTGCRKDAVALAKPMSVEEDKPENERGFYLAPELYNQPPEKRVDRARYPRPPERPQPPTPPRLPSTPSGQSSP